MLLRVKSEEAGELSTGLGSMEVTVTLTNVCLAWFSGRTEEGGGGSEGSRKAPKGAGKRAWLEEDLGSPGC